MAKKNNLELWNKVCTTDPALTKKVTTRGGFTSVCAQSQLKRATELFGSFGATWGLRELKYNFVCDNGKVVGVTLLAEFYYPDGKTHTNGTVTAHWFPIASDMPYKSNDDTFKKLRTDCITKALSNIGFNSDIFEGKFDDNKYVAEMKKKYNTPKAKEPKTTPPKPNATSSAILIKAAEAYIDECPEDYVVDVKVLEAAVLGRFGKLPTKESSVAKIKATIPVEDIIVKNDFVKGLE